MGASSRRRSFAISLGAGLAILLCLSSPRPVNAGERVWEWVKGADDWLHATEVRGTAQVPDPANVPSGRKRVVSWLDASGKLWLAGGDAGHFPWHFSRWNFDPQTGNWTWLGDDPNFYSTIGTVCWTDASEVPWTFGGFNPFVNFGHVYGYTESNVLRKYEAASDQWLYKKGGNPNGGPFGAPGVYGDIGTPAPANTPGSRDGSATWTDEKGDLWLYGGFGFYNSSGAASAAAGKFSDLWKYNPPSNQWTCISGDNLRNSLPVYGERGVSAPLNSPGARTQATAWTDKTGALWLFGGYLQDYYNDLWKYDPASGLWTWMRGDQGFSSPGSYGIRGAPEASNTPGARFGAAAWTDASGIFWLYGGTGFNSSGSGLLDDLWKFDPSAGVWTWVAGSASCNQRPRFTVKGIPDPSASFGGRSGAAAWYDATSDSVWFFGGYGWNSAGQLGYYNDLWRLAPLPDAAAPATWPRYR